MPVFLLHTEKVQQITAIESTDGSNQPRCKYEIWETQAGPMAHVVKLAVANKLHRMNEGIAANLKTYMEQS
jgi:hypothetical protein